MLKSKHQHQYFKKDKKRSKENFLNDHIKGDDFKQKRGKITDLLHT